MNPDDIVGKIQAALPGASVTLEDLTGTKDHWKARIVARQFEGLTLLARHRLVNAALATELKGPIHALTMDVVTPDEAQPA
jgi:stress-induced morphogen